MLTAIQRATRDASIVGEWQRADQTITEIAKRYRVSRDTVYRALRAAGLDTTPRALQDQRPVTRSDFEKLNKGLQELEERISKLEKVPVHTLPGANTTATYPYPLTFSYNV